MRAIVAMLLVAATACGLETEGGAPSNAGNAGTGTGGALAEASLGGGGAVIGGAGGSAAGGSGGAQTGGSGGAGVDAGGDVATDATSAGGSATGGGAGFTTALDGKRIEIPCGAHTLPGCAATQTADTLTFEGAVGTTYDVKLRVRAVAEQNGYIGGVKEGYFYRNGGPDNAGWNVYSITVSGPGGVYYLNAGAAGILYC